MKIRDLIGYVNYISGDTDSINKIGDDNDPFYKELYGGVNSLEYHVGHISDFAVNSNEQIFYELLQNASDAKSTSFLIAFDENHFVAINNGEPFYSDGNKKGKGRLRSFLSLKKGQKYGDDESIGKHGMGSKLLFDLIIPIVDEESKAETKKEDRLIQAIIKEKKGPILYSWSNIPFQRLLNWNYENFQLGSYDDSETPLLTKIINTYFPVIPENNSSSYFKYEELGECISFLNQVSSEINTADYFSGTLLYMKLGKGRSKKLKEALKGNLLSGISSSLASLPHIKRVKINGQLINKPQDFNEIILIDAMPEKTNSGKTKLFLPNDPKKTTKDLSNFFQSFPITTESHGFRFIIDSEEYSIKGSRQTIDITDDHNKKALIKISDSIKSYYKGLFNQNKIEEAVHFIKCILETDLSKMDQTSFYKEYFFDEIIETIKESLPTEKGTFQGFEKVIIKNSLIPVKATDVGLIDHEWLHSSLNEYYIKAK